MLVKNGASNVRDNGISCASFSLPVINEEQAREALLQYVSQHCCYGKGTAQNMTIRDLKSSSAFHVRIYCLRSD